MTIPAQPIIYDGSAPLTVGGQPTEIVNDENIVDWIKSLSPSGATLYDTGWVDVPLLPGFTAPVQPLQARRRSNEVQWRGTVLRTDGNFPAGVNTQIALAPDWARPTGTWRNGAGFAVTSTGIFAYANVSSSGEVIIRPTTAANDYLMRGLSGYLTD